MDNDVKNCSSDLFDLLFLPRLDRSRRIIWTVSLIWAISHTIIPFCLSFTFIYHVGLVVGTVFYVVTTVWPRAKLTYFLWLNQKFGSLFDLEFINKKNQIIYFVNSCTILYNFNIKSAITSIVYIILCISLCIASTGFGHFEK